MLRGGREGLYREGAMSGLTKKPISDGDYLLLCKQSGEGCDYTIGCGVAVINLGPCPSDEQAADKAFAQFGPDGMGLTGGAEAERGGSRPGAGGAVRPGGGVSQDKRGRGARARSRGEGAGTEAA